MIYVNKIESVTRMKEAEQAITYIREHKDIPEGKTYLDGNKLFINVQSYETKAWEECKYEAHKRYIDIQYVLSGEEIVTVTDKEGLTEKAPYSEEKDVVFYNDDKRGTDFVLHAGDFVIVFPDDVHKPKARVGASCAVKKAIVKILI